MSNSWWTSKLGGSQPQTPSYPAYQPPVQPQAAPYQAPQQPQQGAPRLPASAMSSSYCPNCASGNYGSTTPESRARCYDCGYPIVQSASGTPGIRVPGANGGSVEATKQISTQNNFNPGTFIGKIE